MSLDYCPVCGSSECTMYDMGGYSQITCNDGYRFSVSNNIRYRNDDTRDKLFNLILECLLFEPFYDGEFVWRFIFDPHNLEYSKDDKGVINLESALSTYPNDFIELANRSIVNLSRLHPKFGEVIASSHIDVHASFCFGKRAAIDALDFYNLLVNLGYLSNYEGNNGLFCISASGWLKIDELKRKQQEKKQGFIAMSFREETNHIREAFRKSITDAGYSARLIDEKEHNNQIVPEIFYEIQQSKFMVVDVTYPNYGAYYEAGYAQGIGKEVIVCCSKEAFENIDGKYVRPHFDISQKSMVIWNDVDDLIFRLKKRIEATVK